MKSTEIRRKFLDFFKDKEHHIASSASLVPIDPTMLLTGAGMVQFKPIFLGKTKVDYKRAASCQKCVRTTDIDIIGQTGRHLSFFEMLGNFSFGDYYKREATEWAWRVLTEEFKIEKDRLWVTIFETDDEAGDLWRDKVGVSSDRIVKLGEADNFWSAGPTGPCGPCSEILFDQGEEFSCGKPTCAPGCDCDRYLEIWNLVFMQYNRDSDGELHPLPNKSIDTGMGLERIASVLQGVSNNYDTDLILPIIQKLSEISSAKFGKDQKADTSMKIVVDHARAITFMIGDGILPDNDGRGYILRRLIRRAVRHGRLLGIDKAFLGPLILQVGQIMEDQYPEILQNFEFIKTIATREEERFGNTLRQGLSILEGKIGDLKEAKRTQIAGEEAFKLYDTFGFPLELTEEIALESGLEVDRAGFEKLMEDQKVRARASTLGGHGELYTSNVYHQIKEQISQTEFVGYEKDESEAKIMAIMVDGQVKMEARDSDEVEVFLDRSPFYAEKGGQVGDSGVIVAEDGRLEVSNSSAPIADLIAHSAKVTEGVIKLGQPVTATVNRRHRRSISRNHTATHLLHWALRVVVGEHVKQAGSLVGHDRFRFDFNNHQPLTDDEVGNIERLVNDKILQNQPVRVFETTIDYAKKAGALAFFGDKYGQFVRMVEIGNFSKELCGGVHVHNSSEVGFFKIVSESGIGANTRRIEAITGEHFLTYSKKLAVLVNDLSEELKVPVDKIKDTVTAQCEQVKSQAAELSKANISKFAKEGDKIAGKAESLGGISLYTGQVVGADARALRVMADQLRTKTSKGVVVLGSVSGGKALILAAVTKELVNAGLSADSIIKKVAPAIGGVGGGRSDIAQAGGKETSALPKVFSETKKYLREFIEKSLT